MSATMDIDPSADLNPWEARSLLHRFPASGPAPKLGPNADPLICPGLYSRSGLDVMTILALVSTRPYPQIDLGPIDCSVSISISERRLPNAPIVYASSTFVELTGYHEREVIGQKCLFIQDRPMMSASTNGARPSDYDLMVRHAIDTGAEVQMEMASYRKNGSVFNNFVTIVPVSFGGKEYLVTFHGET